VRRAYARLDCAEGMDAGRERDMVWRERMSPGDEEPESREQEADM
jgi:hypothetical protein